jgi:hypothetical protein
MHRTLKINDTYCWITRSHPIFWVKLIHLLRVSGILIHNSKIRWFCGLFLDAILTNPIPPGHSVTTTQPTSKHLYNEVLGPEESGGKNECN